MSVSSSSPSSSSARLAGLQRLLGSPSGVLVLDGGLATELEKDPRVQLDASPLWSAALLLDKYAHLQDAVVTAHKNYFLAGADVATTVSYQASVDGFRREGVESPDKVASMFAQSVELGVQARDQAWQQLQSAGEASGRIEPLVAASIGCYGAALADGSVRHALIALLLLLLLAADRSTVLQWHRSTAASTGLPRRSWCSGTATASCTSPSTRGPTSWRARPSRASSRSRRSSSC